MSKIQPITRNNGCDVWLPDWEATIDKLIADHEQALAAAVQAERERCRTEEARPLMDALKLLMPFGWQRHQNGDLYRAKQLVAAENTLAAVEQVQKEQP